MLRSIGGTKLTASPPISTSPALASSSPAVMRRTVVFPDPDGPTSTMNSPSSISRLRSSTATVPSSKTFLRFRYSMLAISSAPCPAGDHVAVPQCASLEDPALVREVDEDDPEALVVAVLPLEVVEQRPDEVSAHVDALVARAFERLDVLLDVVEARSILDHVAFDAVLEGGAVLGDHERKTAVIAADAEQQLGQRRGDDRPAHRGSRDSLILLGDLEDRVGATRADEMRPVEVDAEKVDRLRDRGEVTIFDRVERPEALLVEGEHVLRITAEQHGVEEPAVVVAVQPTCCGFVLRGWACRIDDGEVERDADPPGVTVASKDLDRRSMGKQRM